MNWQIPDAISVLIHPQMILLEISSETQWKYLYILCAWQYSENVYSPSIGPYFWKCLRTDFVSKMREGERTNIHLNELISVYPDESKDRFALRYIPVSITSVDSDD